MRACLFVAAIALAPGSAHAQGALLESFDDVRSAPEAPASRSTTLPKSVDITASLPSPRAQGETDTCTSWAATYAAASAALRRTHPEQPQLALSPAFTYPLAGGGRFCRGSTYISKTLDVLRDTGALPLQDFAFDPGGCGRQPSPAQRDRAATFRITGWQKVDAHNLSAVKAQLAERRPVIFGMSVGPVFNQFRGGGVFNTIEIDSSTTGHSMVLVGYDDSRDAFRLMNSFGRGWGDQGYAWISYDLWSRKVSVGFVIATP